MGAADETLVRERAEALPVSRYRELEHRRRQLTEIGEIMRAMKNLAMIETRKLSAFLEAQSEAVRCIETAASDFLSFFPLPTPVSSATRHIVLLIGSERGFCGDFNDALAKALSDRLARQPEAHFLVIGNKLNGRLSATLPENQLTAFDGASVAEDVPAILNRLAESIDRLHRSGDDLELTVWFNRHESPDVQELTLLPPFKDLPPLAPPYSHAPLLNLPANDYFLELTEHYLLAILHEIFHVSLMAENQRRVQHLEAAIRRLDDKTESLAKQANASRQEEITEEIEVILLGSQDSTSRAPPP